MRQELERLLDTHRAQRPEMQPQDYYKLLYQREFGCGHTAPAPETAGRHLMEEYARAAGLPGADAVPEHVKGAALPGCVEDIGNGLCRIYLNGSWSREVLRLLGRVFCATAREHKGETACFAAALDGLAHWADAVLPPRDAQTLRRQTGTLRAAGCPHCGNCGRHELNGSRIEHDQCQYSVRSRIAAGQFMQSRRGTQTKRSGGVR